MIDALVRRYASLPVPRYTSYPTAAEFTDKVGSIEHTRWLETLDPAQSVSLYFHVPYCREICYYCGCATKMVLRDELLTNYARVLREEIDQVGRRVSRRRRVSRLHWGGGTPSLIRPAGLAAILETLSAHFVFETGFEHAIELDPRSVTAQLAGSLADLGINRVSLGVQDLNSDVQRAIGRVQPLGVVSGAFEALRRVGIANINVDLVYGLPLQTTESVAATATQVANLGADRIACFGYAHLPKRKRNQRLIDPANLPSASERFAQAQAVADAFAARDYEPIGLDHFARPGDALAIAARTGNLRRNFQGYTDDASPILLGFGASAISRLEAGFVQNIVDPMAYAHSVGGCHLPTARGRMFTPDDRMRGTIIEHLMCGFRVDLGSFGGIDAYLDEIALLRPLIQDSVVSLVDGVLVMTPFGRPFVRVVAAIFDAFRHGVAKGFSVAV